MCSLRRQHPALHSCRYARVHTRGGHFTFFSPAVDRKAKPQERKQAKIVLQSRLNSCCCAISLEIISRLEVSNAIRSCVAPETQGCAFEGLSADVAKVVKTLLVLVHR